MSGRDVVSASLRTTGGVFTRGSGMLEIGTAAARARALEIRLLHSKARVKVLEDELRRRQAQDSVETEAARAYSLTLVNGSRHRGGVSFRIVPTGNHQVMGLCEDKHATSSFHVALTSATGTPLAAQLLIGCPSADRGPIEGSIDEPTLREWERQQGVSSTSSLNASLRLCARLETFNVHTDDLWSSVNVTSRTGCRRLSLVAARAQPLLPPGCISLGLPPRAADRAQRPIRHNPLAERAGPFAELQPASREGRGRTETEIARAVARLRLSRFSQPPPLDSSRLLDRMHRAAWQPVWTRLVGDSVLRRLRHHLTNIALSAMDGGNKERRLDYTGLMNPNKPNGNRWSLTCVEQAAISFCVSYETWFDMPDPTLTLPDPPASLLAAVTNLTRGQHSKRTLSYLSLGSHSKNMFGGDETAVRRYAHGFESFLSRQEVDSRVLLAFETPRANYATPGKFRSIGLDCQASNYRIRLRNLASADGFARSCEKQQHVRCGVLDLFDPVLPFVFDDDMFKVGDPIHFRKEQWAPPRILEAFVRLYQNRSRRTPHGTAQLSR